MALHQAHVLETEARTNFQSVADLSHSAHACRQKQWLSGSCHARYQIEVGGFGRRNFEVRHIDRHESCDRLSVEGGCREMQSLLFSMLLEIRQPICIQLHRFEYLINLAAIGVKGVGTEELELDRISTRGSGCVNQLPGYVSRLIEV